MKDMVSRDEALLLYLSITTIINFYVIMLIGMDFFWRSRKRSAHRCATSHSDYLSLFTIHKSSKYMNVLGLQKGAGDAMQSLSLEIFLAQLNSALSKQLQLVIF